MRKFTTKPQNNIDLQGKEIVSYIELTINVVADFSIAATEYPQKFPGRKQLLKDVVDLLTANGCQVLHSEESNRPESKKFINILCFLLSFRCYTLSYGYCFLKSFRSFW